ncbi:unnamed protein product [Owenia fusiformis]|uniref:Uncharacterized protein n=2 Tax=Owenia fusiformis TaxID=6347 RepID=A0A8J1T553_OWEFU|nr:unnamed protein product [Owenia fusiformis]
MTVMIFASKRKQTFSVFLLILLIILEQGVATRNDSIQPTTNEGTTTEQLTTYDSLNSTSTTASWTSSQQAIFTSATYNSTNHNSTTVDPANPNSTIAVPKRRPRRPDPYCYHPDYDFYSYIHKPRVQTIIACQLILSTIVAVAGVFGSILSIIVLSREKRKNTSIIFLIAMAVSDLLYLLVFLVFEPFYIAYFFTNLTNRTDPTVMAFIKVRQLIANQFLIIFGLISTWLVVCLTIDRFIAIRFPFLAPTLCTVKSAIIELIAICVCAIGISVTKFLELDIILATHPCTLEPMYVKVPADLLKNKAFSLGYNVLFFAIIRNFLPVILVVVLNALLVHSLRAATKRRVEMSGDKEHKANDNNITLVLIIVATMFLICIIPGVIMAILTMCQTWEMPFTQTNHYIIVLEIVVSIGRLLTVINSSCNFFIYCAVRKGFRVTLTRMICGADSKYLPSTTSTSNDTVSTTVPKTTREKNNK